MHVCAKLGWNFTLACPEGYDLNPERRGACAEYRRRRAAAQLHSRDPHLAVRDAHVIYTDTWTSMGQEQEAERRAPGLPAVSSQCALVSEAARDAIVMHCLPAHRNQELTDEVADGPQSVIFEQAHNRLARTEGDPGALVWRGIAGQRTATQPEAAPARRWLGSAVRSACDILNMQ